MPITRGRHAACGCGWVGGGGVASEWPSHPSPPPPASQRAGQGRAGGEAGVLSGLVSGRNGGWKVWEANSGGYTVSGGGLGGGERHLVVQIVGATAEHFGKLRSYLSLFQKGVPSAA